MAARKIKKPPCERRLLFRGAIVAHPGNMMIKAGQKFASRGENSRRPRPSLRVVHSGDEAAARGGGQGVCGHPYLRYIKREAVALYCLLELLQKAFRFRGPSAQDDRDRLVDSRHVAGLRERGPK